MPPQDTTQLNQLGKLLIDICQARNMITVDLLLSRDQSSKANRNRVWMDLSDQGVRHEDIARLFHVSRSTVTMQLRAGNGRNGSKNT